MARGFIVKGKKLRREPLHAMPLRRGRSGTVSPTQPLPGCSVYRNAPWRTTETIRLERGLDYAPVITFVSCPNPPTSTVTRSPACSHTLFAMPKITPSGVPVQIMSPGSNVKCWLM